MLRALLALILGLAALSPATAQAPTYRAVVPGAAIRLPGDHGAHPDFRTEWWYVTGWLTTDGGEQLGFQVTFFRSRPGAGEDNPSAFAPRQILFAHAALSDPRNGKLLHGQRIARQGFGLAEASTKDMDLVIDDWTLRRRPDGRMVTAVRGEGFALDLGFQPTQPAILQGAGGYSRKGPAAGQASYYYSVPHLKVSGQIVRGGKRSKVTGSAWLDREWSSTLLDPRAVGWDWVGLNLDDGAALMAFQVRDGAGRALWAGGSYRGPDGALTAFKPGDVRFSTERRWKSPRTGATYPVERNLAVRLPAGQRVWRLKPLFDDQELDSRASGGPIYWEGAVTTAGGRGYLELTGYATPMKL
ncbi:MULTISPECIES: lipocalin-like domain-containing protein [Phenylobacterium]|uniref:Secreted hydrolase n=1 Tax=Phenylobacterium koreense TaxID=266125 RepID=A0ABV2EJW9_9CAUL